MKTQSLEISATYFPYTFLEEKDLKRLIFYFDTLYVLQVLPDFEPGLPAVLRSSQMVQPFQPVTELSLLETIGQTHQNYQRLGGVHQNGGLRQLLRSFALQEDFENSRTSMVARIRQAHPQLTPEVAELVNDGVFLLLAHQLDHDHLELDVHMERIRALEAKLHEEAGIATDEESDAMAMRSPLLKESDPPRTQYAYERLRAWTRLYSSQEQAAPFLPLTTSPEVLAEISERLPSQSSAAAEGMPLRGSEQKKCLSVLPDPQKLSLEKIVEFRQSVSRESFVDTWRESVTVAVNLLQQEAVPEDQWQELQQRVQKAADAFQQHWPVPEKPTHYLRLECACYPKVPSELAFSLVTGLQPAAREPHPAETVNGVSLLLSPADL
ncbi:MAG: hypothetical protein LJE87_01970 [Deltaproteobacteria bacterium]|nr:hypothetical protein [Deltaproteobacteria bacterium]